MKKEKRIQKIITLLQETQKQGGISIGELAQKLNVTERTIYADLKFIECKMDLPLQRPKNRSRQHEGKYLLIVEDNDNEWELASLYSMVLEKKLWPSFLYEKKEDYLVKNPGYLKNGLQLNLHGLKDKLIIKDFEIVNSNESKNNLKIFLQSLIENREIEIIYTSFFRDNEIIRRVIRTYGLVWCNANWYTVAYCLLRKDIRIFKLDRVINTKLLETTFIRPEDFNFNTYFADSWGIVVNPNQEPKEVKLLFSPQVANEIIKYKYHSSQKNRWIDNGWLEVTFIISVVSEMKNWVLSWGSEVLVVEPEELRQELIQQLKNSLHNLGVSFSEKRKSSMNN